MAPAMPNRKYTDEEKQHLLANLEIEVAHKTRQFESWLADHLENFNMHQEGQVSRIPKQVRNMTMREFGDKYHGNVQAALRGYQKERLVAAGGDATLGEIDKSVRKRKWVASQDQSAETSSQGSKDRDPSSSRATKNARIMASTSPQKTRAGSSTGPGTAQRSRMMNGHRTPSSSRTLGRIPPSPGPQKPRPPFNSNTTVPAHAPRQPSRPASPQKHPGPHGNPTTNRVPSSSTFNPMLPPKTPAYPKTARLPRKDESMLSVNGSPLANPFDVGIQWFKGVGEMGDLSETDGDVEEGGVNGESRALKRSKSSIIIRRDPSVAYTGLRTASQAIDPPSSQSSDSSQQSTQPASLPSQPRYPSTLGVQQPPPPSNQRLQDPQTPKSLRTSTRSFSALVAIPTKDGHLLEFDPFQTSPGAIDALEGISDSAKKQARAEMGRLVQAAVDKWRIG